MSNQHKKTLLDFAKIGELARSNQKLVHLKFQPSKSNTF